MPRYAGAPRDGLQLSVSTTDRDAAADAPSPRPDLLPALTAPMLPPAATLESMPLLAIDAVAPAHLEAALREVEFRLGALGEALQLLDSKAIDQHAAELHRALAEAIACFSDAARFGPVALALRQRLAVASGRVAAQRNTLAQATAALDRAIDILLPDRSRPQSRR